jgi:hypothetical protein
MAVQFEPTEVDLENIHLESKVKKKKRQIRKFKTEIKDMLRMHS